MTLLQRPNPTSTNNSIKEKTISISATHQPHFKMLIEESHQDVPTKAGGDMRMPRLPLDRDLKRDQTC